ncbi:trafficking kinesin-binding protein 1 isoform X1 [Salmo trutta]|uniref:trafficking kinesin-binding protein 1 isoform X1 n=1 Tax=Salmo trutta TaxID=8032 RepID=UPI001131FDEB|nr:trafficking kinesin-binding protein 1-like isoform X1 [Salmo trutta]XP_029632815.1 trafficking kinesin-binding protein 1-like isoform X1 [Salmo trutta]XP_029632816.1 trafficking kinesin-binding protein 1-like isoform X1 [Salmo trutta]XP_029632817.1 trafficking kinesin-binding protein 1-like isoform X1 [Salmo trutta]
MECDLLERVDRGSHDVSTLTELCSGGDSEVEIVSLLSEGLPNYTLRADCMFGYDHDDWLHTPLLPPEVALGLTHDQIEETLKYFLLCSERVGQVTKTYHDIEAVTHLLEENEEQTAVVLQKERDLELAARIGQSLLKQNRDLTARNELMDEQLEIAKEEIAQLRHELSMRDDLLHLYASTEEIENASDSHALMKRNESSNSLSNFVNYDFIQQKLKGLEEENLKLRCEANELTSETANYEEQEQELMMVCVEELTSVNKQVVDLSDELARKVEDTLRQQEEISSLLAQIVDLQARCKRLTTDNEELTQHLSASRENQSQLKSELNYLQDKYSECEDMLRETREDIKNLRNKSLPNSTVQRYSSLSAVFPMDSLAAEIEGTFRKGLDVPAPSEYKNHPWRVFETVKVVNHASRLRSRCHSPGQVPGSSPVSLRSSRASTPRTSYYGSDSASFTLEDKPPSAVSRLAEVAHTEDSSVSGPKRLGMPGMPGGQDLEAALRCLSDRQQSHASERPFFEVERERKLRALATACQRGSEEVGELGSSGFLTPNDSLVSSSVASTGTNYSNGSSLHSSAGSGGSRSYLPDRLQIVKPLEGSVTLHHWQQLAKPNLGGILHPRPGVLTKDFRELEIDLQHVYSLNDLEEDEPDLLQLSHGLAAGVHGTTVTPPSSGPNLPQTPPTHTVTNCRRHHPSLLLPSFSTSLCSRSLSARGSCEHLTTTSPSSSNQQHCVLTFDPSQGGGHHSTSTPAPALSLGLLKLLKEQGISASTLPYPYHQLTPHTPHTRPTTAEEERGGGTCTMEEEGRMNIFSFNLVEKLRSLGLHKVAARGVVD